MGTLILLVRNLVTMRLADSRLRSISLLQPQPTVRHHHIRLSVLGTLGKTNTVSVIPFSMDRRVGYMFSLVLVLVNSQHTHRRPRHDVLSLNVASFPLHSGSLFQALAHHSIFAVICLTCTPGYDSN